jgi:hypothetical protein
MPPLAATGVLQMANWFKDDLPDLLWPALVLAEQGNESVRRFVRWQKAVQEGLAEYGEAALVAELLDGRLTHLSQLLRKFRTLPMSSLGRQLDTACSQRGCDTHWGPTHLFPRFVSRDRKRLNLLSWPT